MAALPTLGKSGTIIEEEDPDGRLFRDVPRTIPSSAYFNKSYLRGSTSASNDNNKRAQDKPRDDELESTRWNRSRNSSLAFQPTTPQAHSTREHAKAHPEDFYSPIEDGDDEDDDEKDEQEEVKHRNGEEDDDDDYLEDGAQYDFHPDNNSSNKEKVREIHGDDHYGKLETHPKMDHQDTLWTEIDALDDVKNLAQTIDLYEGFPLGFEDQLQKIRESHSSVLKAMRDRNAKIEEEKRHEITSKSDSQSSNGLDNSVSRIVSNATPKPDKRANQEYVGPTVLPNEDKYVQELIESIKSLRT